VKVDSAVCCKWCRFNLLRMIRGDTHSHITYHFLASNHASRSSAVAERPRDSVVGNFAKSLKITQGHSKLHRCIGVRNFLSHCQVNHGEYYQYKCSIVTQNIIMLNCWWVISKRSSRILIWRVNKKIMKWHRALCIFSATSEALVSYIQHLRRGIARMNSGCCTLCLW